jgi:hypothetical protein
MEMKIREFHHSDIPHLMEICLKTGDDGKDGTDCYSDPHFIGQLYALPYVIHNPELCMVVHEHEIPVGYILGTDDTREFYRWMENQYLPTLRRRYPSGMQCASQTEEFFLSLMHTDRSWSKSIPGFLLTCISICCQPLREKAWVSSLSPASRRSYLNSAAGGLICTPVRKMGKRSHFTRGTALKLLKKSPVQ